MPRFTNGWVKSYRSLYHSHYDGWDMAILGWLISAANYVDGKSLVCGRGGRILLKRGQLVTSLSEIHSVTKFSKSVINRRLKRYAEENIIEIQTKHSGTVITILNYDKYQCIESEQETQTKQKENASGNTSGLHIEELKNLRKEIHLEPQCSGGENLNTDPEKTNKPKKPKPPKEPKPKKEASTAHLVVARYCDLFKEKFNVMPTITGVDAGALGKLNKTYGEEKAIRIVEAYFNLNDKWLADQYYSARLIHGQVNKIVVILEKSSPSSEAKTVHDLNLRWL